MIHFNKPKVSLVIFTFLMMFSPPIFPKIMLMYVLATFSLFMLLTAYRKDIFLMLRSTRLDVFVGFFGFITAYSTVIGCLTIGFGGEATLGEFMKGQVRLLTTSPILVVCILYFLVICKKQKYTFQDITDVIIYAGLIQSIVALTAFLVPEVKTFLVHIMQANVGGETLARDWIQENRLFGFARDLFDHFGYGMGIVAALPIFQFRKKHQFRYLIFTITLLGCGLINARSTLVSFLAMILTVTLSGFLRDTSFKRLRNRPKNKIALLVAVGLSLGGFHIVGCYNPTMVSNAISDFVSVSEFVSTGELPKYNSTGSRLFTDSFWKFPPGVVNLLFGTGHSAYQVSSVSHSDVGYVNDVWMFGVIGSSILYSCIVFYALRASQGGGAVELGITTGVLLATVLYQIKGTAFWSANLGIMMYLLLVSSVYATTKRATIYNNAVKTKVRSMA